MKVAYSWLKEYADLTADPQAFGADMTMSGSKVEAVEEQGKDIDKVVTAKILKIDRHPDADKLVVCQVDIGSETIQIVTGATNVFEGAVIPAALNGSTLPGGIKIKKGKLRGVESNGMMCSVEELGIGENADGILILPEDTPIGVDIKEALSLNDSIIEFEITSNRADCFSVIGLGREAAATYGVPFRLHAPSVKGGAGENPITVEVKDPDLCPRYSARLIRNVKIAPSPEWMQKRLEASGVRAINNIVDITNYVMLEYGQPMHAFDTRYLRGGKIIVRRAEEGEKMNTLDGVERTFKSSNLVIADGEGAVAVAGVMGGENSEVRDDTTEILFESANFHGASVRITAKQLGLRTESSARFEKGLDANNTLPALDRACELIELLGAGEVVGGVIDVKSELPQSKEIPFCPEQINTFLGSDIAEEEMVRILKSLDFEVKDGKVICPTWRADVIGEADIAEEVLRIYGYNNIPSTLLRGETVVGGKNDKQIAEDLAAQTLVGQGFYEIMTYSFVNPKTYPMLRQETPDLIRILNPLGEENSVMRTTTMGSMMDILAGNYSHRNADVRLFENGTVYHKGGEDGLAIEEKYLTLGMYGKNADYFALKGAVEAVLEAFGISYYDIEPLTDHPSFHPGQTAKLTLHRKPLAEMGRVHPLVCKNYGIGEDCYIAMISFSALLACRKAQKTYKALPKFPAMTRDLAVLVDRCVTARQIEDVIRRVKTQLLESCTLFDVYEDEKLGENKKSMAYSLVFRVADRTLTDEEVNPVMDEIVSKLSETLGAALRS